MYGCLVWGGPCTNEDRRNVSRVIRRAEKIIGAALKPWAQPWGLRTIKKAKEIKNEPNHPLNSYYQTLPSQRRLRLPSTRT